VHGLEGEFFAALPGLVALTGDVGPQVRDRSEPGRRREKKKLMLESKSRGYLESKNSLGVPHADIVELVQPEESIAVEFGVVSVRLHHTVVFLKVL
jgi:hypothetical protein